MVGAYLSSASKYFITTPIFYVNAAPHLGHLYSMLLCDFQKRWLDLKETPNYFTTGTDEHGLKVQIAAELNKTDPRLFCDNLSNKFKHLAQISDIQYDRFIRTTDADHLATVRQFWETVWKNGYIYKGKHSGWYSVSDETFYPESQVEQRDGKTVSTETGSEVVYESEENYFFKLSAFQSQLIDLYKANPQFVIPANYYSDLLKELEREPLQDLSISRPSSRLQWGISVPNDESQKIYVWFDALVNYLTSIGYPSSRYKEFWPGTHLIGKDISRFHCIYWPAFLMAAKVSPPEKVVVHGHWLMGGSKMSKSKGNVADPLAIGDYYGVDSLRLFLGANSILSNDCDFTERKLNDHRDLFIDKICNVVTRCISKSFDPARSVMSFSNEDMNLVWKRILERGWEGDLEKAAELKKSYDEIVDDAQQLFSKIDVLMSTFTTHKSVGEIFDLMLKVNQFVNSTEPWNLKSNERLQDLSIFVALDVTRVCLILLQPFIPGLSNKLLDMIKVESSKRTATYAAFQQDSSYGQGAKFLKGSTPPLIKVPLRAGAYE
ncbi:Mitochondrial methionyl-tRNA synthetase [Komagataella phaffii CBS 7435]|uniref:Probable methionine--tRNA ligase, mitochondrial n=2 Tax=Komagataella phaffii TaxID=460519 RepID=C4R0J3_KOMPG|nr:Mitochondrial methionyl-tRNA synthetase (MetRS) [Komagataella phaffii GS115]AOA63074.1 GQ67_00437T0 [Komagataella phaffii]CAH2448465.1 Mitochondrial methionyl-tRNA synthetase [Komagataella phaffii CBS 7435]AOA68134.1 GQ68_00952T0 [Komagataella phaffii GS115]CAY69017.1 Mitochondrial methionyl-tRNA synthetase (MetRS) [Komagataella phaffii GS115]CCA38584.1 Mitochondrial methionyl-tRNA synthetase [Komagataella phaffii CBS 7435]